MKQTFILTIFGLLYSVVSPVVASPLLAAAQTTASCNAPKPSGNIRPKVANGFKLQVVANGLSRPRGLAFDSAGNLLVVQAGSGSITSHKLNDNGGCVLVADSKTVVSGLNVSPQYSILLSSVSLLT